MASINQSVAASGEIRPEVLYRIDAFRSRSGLGHGSEAAARAKGIELKRFKVGRCHFVRGHDGIDYINRLATSQLDD